MSTLGISKERLAGGIILVSLKGYLDAHTYEQFENTLNGIFSSNVYKVILDLSNLDYISSAGAGVIISAISTVQENDGNLVIINPSNNVKEVFDLLGLSQILIIVPTREQALRAFK